METSSAINAKETVASFIDALNKEDFNRARTYTADDMKFVGVLGTRDGADAYFTDMEKMKLKYDIRQLISEGSDVCVQYDIAMAGLTIFSIGWYTVEQGKIKLFKVLFDPRPVLEASKK
jgi:hypothetical protein